MPEPLDIREVVTTEEPTAVVRTRSRWGEFGPLIRPSLDQVYAFLADGPVRQAGPNVIVYLGEHPTLEIGVVVDRAFADQGAIVSSFVPSGRSATAVHVGPYDRLGATHSAVQAWCAAHDKVLAGASWERYGDWNEDPEQLETEVHYLLR